MELRGRVLAAWIVSCVLGACTSSTNSPSLSSDTPTATTIASVRYGKAVANPARVSRGGRITISPTGPVQMICTFPSTVWTQSPRGLIPTGMLSQNGTWQSSVNGFPTTVPGCLPPPTADAQSYDVPQSFVPGTYVFCLTMELDPAACTSVEVA